MEIKALLRDGLTTVEADAPVRQALEVLRRTRARAVPVLRATELVGMLTERDVRRADASVLPELARYDWTALLDRVTAGHVMGPVVASLAANASAEDAARLMTELEVDSLPVVDDGGALVGVVSTADVLEFLIGTRQQRSVTGFDHVIGVCQRQETGRNVAVTAHELAREHGARLTLLHPLVPFDRSVNGILRSELLATVADVRIRQAQEWLAGLLEPGAEPSAVCRVLSGDPPQAVCQAASESGADLIVMELGRDREQFIRHAPCPVLAV